MRHAFIEKSERKHPDNGADNMAGNALYTPISAADCGKRKAWLRKIRQITDDSTIPAQAINLAHVGVSALSVTEKY